MVATTIGECSVTRIVSVIAASELFHYTLRNDQTFAAKIKTCKSPNEMGLIYLGFNKNDKTISIFSVARDISFDEKYYFGIAILLLTFYK